MHLTAGEQQVLRLLIDDHAVADAGIGRRTQGDIDQTADTADTVLANGVLGEAPQPEGTQQGRTTRLATARLNNEVGSHVQVVLLSHGDLDAQGLIKIHTATGTLMQQIKLHFRATTTSLQYASLQVPARATVTTLNLKASSGRSYYWSLSRF